MIIAAFSNNSLAPFLERFAALDSDFAAAYSIAGPPPNRSESQGFPGLMRIVVSQQLSSNSAKAIFGRLNRAIGLFNAENFLKLKDKELKDIGLSRNKIRYGKAIAESLITKQFNFNKLNNFDDETAINYLTQLPGIGRWSAEIYLLFALGREDIFPSDDLALQIAFQRMKKLNKRPTSHELRHSTLPWKPNRSAGAQFLWHFYSSVDELDNNLDDGFSE